MVGPRSRMAGDGLMVWSDFLRVYLNLRSIKKSKFWIFAVEYEGCEGRTLDWKIEFNESFVRYVP